MTERCTIKAKDQFACILCTIMHCSRPRCDPLQFGKNITCSVQSLSLLRYGCLGSCSIHEECKIPGGTEYRCVIENDEECSLSVSPRINMISPWTKHSRPLHKWNQTACCLFHSASCLRNSSLLLYVAVACFLSLPTNIPLCAYITIHSSVDEHLGGLQFETIMNKAAIHWLVHILLWTYTLTAIG